jgi:lipopolysaccharide/colanic/teichoic acid biosynthesis glycosyltransferase
MRRLGDIAIAMILLGITLPLLLLVAIAIRWEGAGPVLEWQERIGPNGRPYRMLRFRTTMYDSGYRTRQVTQVGQFLRYTGIDELPQLFNVLRGEMTLHETTLPFFLRLADNPYHRY